MNEDVLLKGVTTSVTRRTVVKTGAKLAYAAPLVAVSFKLSGAGSALAAADCSCVAEYRSPKPGGTGTGSAVGGDPTKCYTCKGVAAATDVCGNPTTSNIGVYDDGIEVVPGADDDPVCACLNPNGCTVTVGGVEHHLDQYDTNTYCNGGAPLGIDCGGGSTQSVPTAP